MQRTLDRRRFLRVATQTGVVLLGGGLLSASGARAQATTRPADAIERIAQLAATSPIARYAWADRGKAPIGYIKGMAVSFAKVSQALRAGDPYAVEMAKPLGADAATDALKHYETIFRDAGLDPAQPGEATLRRLFVLMLGLGMRESSGRYCEGRDRSASNTTAETAEAGLFQTSFNARRASPLLPKLFDAFKTRAMPSYLELFSEGVRPRDRDLENFGTGDGLAFQTLSKECPFFAVEFAAIGLRNIRKHWGPINRRAAEVKPDADAMFIEVQKLVDREQLAPLL